MAAIRARAAALLLILATAACGQSGPRTLEKPDPIIRGINFVGLTVPDLDAAQSYYSAAVETEVVENTRLEAGNPMSALHPEGDGAAQTRLLRRTNAQVRLFAFDKPSEEGRSISAVPVYGPGIAHICFQVADETHAHQRILAAGAVPVGSRELVQLNKRNPVRYGYVKDPNGVITEIEQIDVAKLDLPKPPKNLFRIRHVSLATPDIDRLIAFYSAFLGGQEPRRVGNWFNVSGEAIDKVSGQPGSKVEMAWFQLRNLEIEIFQYHSHSTKLPAKSRPLDAPGYNMIVFDVSDIAEAKRRLLTAGGRIVTDMGPLDGGKIIFGRDPDGNLIGLQQLPASSVYSAANFPNNGMQ